MLHQPSAAFTPPVDQYVFDASAYIETIRKAGMTIVPIITHAGRRTYSVRTGGSTGYGRAFDRVNALFQPAFDDDFRAERRVFECLCGELEIEPTADDVNEKVAALLGNDRSHRQDEARLISRCQAAIRALEIDAAAAEASSEASDKMQVWTWANRPKVPSTIPGRDPAPDKASSALLRDLPGIVAVNSKAVVAAFRQRIAAMKAFERAEKAYDREVGFTRAARAAEAAAGRAKVLVTQIAFMEATTIAGLAAKAEVADKWRWAGYGLNDEGEELVLSIAADARRIAGAPISRRRLAERPSAQVHH